MTATDNVPATPVLGRFADPGPLGLAAFALTTFVLSTVNAGLLPKTVEGVVFGLALFYGGLSQFAAGLWEFAKGNTFGATAFCSYGGFWMAFWYLAAHTDLSKASASDAGHGVGVFLLGWTIFTGYMFLASLRTTGAIAAVFAALFLTFLLLAVGALAASATITKVGGWLGIITAVLAWYASFAGVFNETAKRVVLPVLPR